MAGSLIAQWIVAWPPAGTREPLNKNHPVSLRMDDPNPSMGTE